MTSTIAKTALGAFAALALGSAARAADVDINVRAEEYGSYHRLVGDDDRDGDDDGWRRHGGFEERGERGLARERGRFYGRPVPDWPMMGRPVYARPGWGRHEDDCRLIVKRRVNRWGDLVIRRIRVCD
jgi:hypothetical protein